MNCLLTGVNGFLGQSILKEISNSNNVIGLSRTNSDYNIDLGNETPIFKIPFDIVIHAAGKAHSLPKSKSEILEFNRVNVIGTQNLLKGLDMSISPKKFVFISSVSVYGLDSGINITENYPLNAIDIYGKSKIDAERIVLDWCKTKGVICTILRLPLIVGLNPPGNLGAMINGIKKGYYFNIAGGKAKKSMVLADDISKVVLKVADVGGIYNLTDGYHPTFAEISNHISSKLGKKAPYNLPLGLTKIIASIGDLLGNKSPINSNKLKKIVSELTFDDSKARQSFGWNPTPVLESHNIL